MSLTFTRPIVMIDIDNTLYDFTGAMGFDHAAVREYDDIKSLAGDDWDDLHHQVISERFMTRQGLYDGALKAVSDLRAHGIEVLVYTKRPNAFIDGTIRALRGMGLQWDMFLGGNEVEKVPVCRELGVNLLVDDAPFTITEAAECGLPVVSMFHHYVTPLAERGLVVPFNTWEQGYDIVTEKLVTISA
jgi:uncharacterized HAD superfamily protein